MESALCEHKRTRIIRGRTSFCDDCHTYIVDNTLSAQLSNPDSIYPEETEADRKYQFTDGNKGVFEVTLSSGVEKQYVAGFLFSRDLQHVVLIEKNKPDWQAGKMNGVGGKIEPGETPEQAMRREFNEEAGVDVPDWKAFCVLNWRGGAIHFFRAVGNVSECYTKTDEVIRRIPTEYLDTFKIVRHLRWLVPMAMESHVGSATVEDIS